MTNANFGRSFFQTYMGFAVIGLITSLSAGISCGGGGGGGGEPTECPSCGDDFVVESCQCFTSTNASLGYVANLPASICGDWGCADACLAAYPSYHHKVGIETKCVPDGNSAICTYWEPGDYIWGSGSSFSIDQGFLYPLSFDASPLVDCDTARLIYYTGVGFVVEDAVSGDFLYEIGLRDGDIPLEVNSYPLSNYSDASVAFIDLWLEGEQYYEIVILRDEERVTLEWTLFSAKP